MPEEQSVINMTLSPSSPSTFILHDLKRGRTSIVGPLRINVYFMKDGGMSMDGLSSLNQSAAIRLSIIRTQTQEGVQLYTLV